MSILSRSVRVWPRPQPRCFVTGGFLDRDVVHQRVAALFGVSSTSPRVFLLSLARSVCYGTTPRQRASPRAKRTITALFPQKLAEDMPALKGAKVEADSALGKDLGLDSLEQTEVLMAVEEEFGVRAGASFTVQQHQAID